MGLSQQKKADDDNDGLYHRAEGQKRPEKRLLHSLSKEEEDEKVLG